MKLKNLWGRWKVSLNMNSEWTGGRTQQNVPSHLQKKAIAVSDGF
jgi:hypothetical protein